MDSTLVSQELEISDQSRTDRSSLLVPRDDHAFLVRPAFRDSLELLDENIAQRDRQEQILGTPFDELREQVRHECIEAAKRYTRSLRSTDSPNRDEPAVEALTNRSTHSIVATGHQPDLFHPGVWVKNIAVAEIARRKNAVGLSLIVDNDLMQSRSIRLPVGSASVDSANANSRDLSQKEIAFDEQISVRVEPDTRDRQDNTEGVNPALPCEEVRVVDEVQFEQFAENIQATLSQWSLTPAVNKHWHAGVALGSQSRLGDRLTAVRVNLENSLGIANFELPMSQVCDTAGFRWFLFSVVSRIEQFATAYNDALKAFRELNHIRSHTHPVPELATTAECFEAPFWVWSSSDPIRRPVFVSQTLDEIVLGTALDGSGEFARLPTSRSSYDQAVEILLALAESGVKIRTRALTTTMFVRMFLCDLFVHGIGGARYDEMTDDIIEEFFGIKPAGFLTISYTAWLPFAHSNSESIQDVHALKQRIRDLQQNPQRYLDRNSDPQISQLIAEKEQLIEEQHQAQRLSVKPQNWSGVRRYRRIPEINRILASETQPLIEDAHAELQRVESNLAANDFITDREISYCAFPEERLSEMVLEVKNQFEPSDA
jgi:hypothetical protein